MNQAMKEDPPPNVKCKDKFLVQSTIITPEKESLPLTELVRPHSFCRCQITFYNDKLVECR